MDNVNMFISYLYKNSKILDIGCGPGHYSKYFDKCGYDVTGIDFSNSMISIARKLCTNVNFVQKDMRNLDFKEKSFDALWVCASFPHIPKIHSYSILNDFKRLLKKNGILFINAIIGNEDYRIENSCETNTIFEGVGRYFQWYPNKETVSNMLREVGFKVDKTSERIISSDVLENAVHKINMWCNYFCISV
jgi:ubiquinone/menaquinone biosynthesis C-methylase UbiE